VATGRRRCREDIAAGRGSHDRHAAGRCCGGLEAGGVKRWSGGRWTPLGRARLGSVFPCPSSLPHQVKAGCERNRLQRGQQRDVGGASEDGAERTDRVDEGGRRLQRRIARPPLHKEEDKRQPNKLDDLGRHGHRGAAARGPHIAARVDASRIGSHRNARSGSGSGSPGTAGAPVAAIAGAAADGAAAGGVEIAAATVCTL